MLWCGRRPPGSDRFFGAYWEFNPMPPGEERFPVLFLPELLSALAHDGATTPGVISGVHQILAPFRARRCG